MSDKQFALSRAQQSIWHLHQLAPLSNVFNIGCAFQITQKTEIQQAKHAILKIIERHEALRTTYDLNNTGVYKIIHDSITIDLEFIDGTQLSQPEINTVMNSVLQEPIDIKKGPVVKFRLVTLEPGIVSTLLICAHHIALDQFSLSIIKNELKSLLSNPNIPLPQIKSSYADYVSQEEQYTNSPGSKTKLNFWKLELANASSSLDIPTDMTRPSLRNFRGNTHQHSIETDLKDRINAFAKQHKIKPYDILLTAFSVLLKKHSSQDTIMIGLPIDCRLQNNTYENIVGVFSNHIPLKIDFAKDFTVASLLEHITSQVIKSKANCEYPFDLLVKNLIPVNDFSRAPVFQVLFDWQESELENSTYYLKQEEGQFDLSLMVYDFETHFNINLRYATQLFTEETITNFVVNFTTILDHLLSNMTSTISDIPLLSEIEQRKITQDWNNTFFETPQYTSIQSIFELQVDKTPEAIAVIAGNATYTYKKLDEHANQIANILRNHSVKNGMLIGIYIDRSIDMLVGLLGILKAGATYVPLDPSFPAERIHYIINDSNVSLIITKKRFLPELSFSGEYICLDDLNYEENPKSVTRPLNINVPENLAYILYTSGSTGKPKGVEISHESMVNFLLSMIETPGLRPNDTFCAITTISFDIAVLELFGPICSGAKVIILDNETSKDVIRLSNAIISYEPTIMQATPATWEMLCASGWKGIPNLRILCGGEALRPDLANRLLSCGGEVWNMYGPTETTVWSSCCKVSKTDKVISVGKPIANTLMYILDSKMRILPSGIQGDLYIGGKGVAKGYHNRPDLTESKFFPNPFSSTPNARIYSTGDRARYLNDGNIVIMGRSDFQIKIRGFRVEPGEIEIILRSHPSIKDAIVITRNDHSNQVHLVAYIVKSIEQVSIANIKQHCIKHLPEYMIPSFFIFIDTVPLTPNGKVNKLDLPAIPDNPYKHNAIVPPRTKAETLIAAIWKRLLLLENIGIHESFFDLGGTSLSASLLAVELRNQFNQDISVVQLFQYPTIQALADLFNGSAQEDPGLKKISERGYQEKHQPIAIIGMSGRFPGADSIDKLWANLVEGKESITHFSREELDEIEEELRNDPAYIPSRGILTDIDMFDAAFFGIRHSEAQIMDPQQRILMETAWSALEDAGYDANRFDGLIGVFAGMGNNTYFKNNVSTHPEIIKRLGEITVELGTEKDHIAPRISYAMNLRGPSLSIHTACSTTLVVIDSAFHALNSGQCDIALAGGIDISIPQKSGQLFQEGGIFTKDGHCRPFDADASGTMFGEAVGIVVLKRLEDAIADHDNVYAVILGTAVNHDGSQKANYLAPSENSQAEVIALAQARAKVHPETIGYIETHGTATPIGDPIEIEGLTKAFRLKTDKKQYCAIGSVKGNLGHSTTAAGITGLIKATLITKYGQIPPSINYSTPNPRIDFKNSPFFVNTKLSSWPISNVLRRVGVSSFGFCGTNAHVILEEPPLQKEGNASRPGQLIMLSAKSKTSLDNLTEKFRSFFNYNKDNTLSDIAFTLQNGRNFLKYRKFIVCSDSVDAAVMLNQPDPNRSGQRTFENSVPQIVFLFPGQGSQYVNMGKSLYRDEPLFKETVDHCATILKPHLGRDIRELLYPSENDEETAALSLKETRFTQPAIFIIEYALARLWMHWGIHPAAMIGHSIGEFVCACLAEVFSLEDALALIARRGSLMQNLPRGSMLSVRLDVKNLSKILPEGISIAAINGPELCVISGPIETIAAFAEQSEKNGIICKQLHSSHAFHSAMMNPVVEPFQEYIKQISLAPPQIPFVSTVTGEWISSLESTDPSYWANHLRAPVNFSDAIAEVLKESPRILLEVGPRSTSATLARQQIIDPLKHAAIPSLSDTFSNETEWNALLKAVGTLWLWGININWNNFYKTEYRRKLSLPTYSFDKVRHWIDPANKNLQNKSHKVPSLQKELPMDQKVKSSGKHDVKLFMLEKIRKIIEDISGTSISESSFNTSFLDLGLDSLVLTQIAKVISRETKSQINLRHLMEYYPSVNFLTNYLLDTLSDELVDSLMPEQLSATTTDENNSNPSEPIKSSMPSLNEKSLENVIIRQMDIIERLITLLETRDRNNQTECTPVGLPIIKKSIPPIVDSAKTNDTFMQINNPPVPGARLGRDENGNPAWYIPDQSHNGNFIKLGN